MHVIVRIRWKFPLSNGGHFLIYCFCYYFTSSKVHLIIFHNSNHFCIKYVPIFHQKWFAELNLLKFYHMETKIELERMVKMKYGTVWILLLSCSHYTSKAAIYTFGILRAASPITPVNRLNWSTGYSSY